MHAGVTGLGSHDTGKKEEGKCDRHTVFSDPPLLCNAFRSFSSSFYSWIQDSPMWTIDSAIALGTQMGHW